jgi:hypothetical protein
MSFLVARMASGSYPPTRMQGRKYPSLGFIRTLEAASRLQYTPVKASEKTLYAPSISRRAALFLEHFRHGERP